MASAQPAGGSGSALDKLKGWVGLPAIGGMKPIQTQPGRLERQNSFPEICSTPSEVGIFEVAHNKARGPDGKFSWKKFLFEAPGRPDTPPRNGAATSGGAAAAAGASSSTPPQ